MIMFILNMVSLVLFIEFLSFQHFINPNKLYCCIAIPENAITWCALVLVPFFKPLCTVHNAQISI